MTLHLHTQIIVGAALLSTIIKLKRKKNVEWHRSGHYIAHFASKLQIVRPWHSFLRTLRNFKFSKSIQCGGHCIAFLAILYVFDTNKITPHEHRHRHWILTQLNKIKFIIFIWSDLNAGPSWMRNEFMIIIDVSIPECFFLFSV